MRRKRRWTKQLTALFLSVGLAVSPVCASVNTAWADVLESMDAADGGFVGEAGNTDAESGDRAGGVVREKTMERPAQGARIPMRAAEKTQRAV